MRGSHLITEDHGIKIRLIYIAPLLLLLIPARSQAKESRIWNFDADVAGQPPSHFSFGRTGQGRSGRWVVQADPAAPSRPNVLAQVDDDPVDYRFPVAVADGPALKNPKLTVQCRMVSGQADQAAGLVFRYQDENNYYVTRANALENNVRLYKVVNGRREQFAGWNGAVTPNAWHDYRAEIKDDHFEVYWDGRKVIDAKDGTFSAAGKVGVWTKADSVTYFDNLSIEPLGS